MTDMVYPNFSQAWVSQLLAVQNGEAASPRGLPTRERRWVQFTVTDPLFFPVAAEGREFKDVIGALEALSLVGQFSIPELFTDRVAKFGDFLDAGVFHGAYATRAHGALGDVVSLLERDPDSRQAVISVFDSSRDLDRLKKDIPCTLSIHFMRRGSELEARVTMRSNDVWLGTPYDFTQFAVLQASVAQSLGLTPGKYVHSAGSLHMYDRDLGRAQLVKASAGRVVPMRFPLWDTPDDIGEISKRARDIALGRVSPKTEFERWASDLVWPDGAWYPGVPEAR